MTTPQILKSIARKLGITFRVPSSESQKLEAVSKAIDPLVADAPYPTGAVFTAGGSDDTLVLTFSGPIELGPVSDPGDVALFIIDSAAGSEELTVTAVEQTGTDEITITADTGAIDTPDAYAVQLTGNTVSIIGTETGARVRTTAGGLLVYAEL